MELILALGSNLGDRQASLDRAVQLLQEDFGPLKGQSNTLETKALGFNGPDFLNCLVSFDCSLPAPDVLAICKSIERKMGRCDVPRWDSLGRRIYEDRIIDIDVLLYGDLKMSTETLTIPHPAVDSRPFIKELLLNLRPL